MQKSKGFVSITSSEFDRHNYTTDPFALKGFNDVGWFKDYHMDQLGLLLVGNPHKEDPDKQVYALLEFGRVEWSDGTVDDEYRTNSYHEFPNEHLAHIYLLSDGGLRSQGDLIYENNTRASLAHLVTVDDAVKRVLANDPVRLHELTPRKFEELIASILEDAGFHVELTKQTRDGGYDILAHLKNQITKFVMLVECKRYSSENKVDVSVVRQIIGVHNTVNPAKSLIVTTSSFTNPAKEMARTHEHILDLHDFKRVSEMLAKYRY